MCSALILSSALVTVLAGFDAVGDNTHATGDVDLDVTFDADGTTHIVYLSHHLVSGAPTVGSVNIPGQTGAWASDHTNVFDAASKTFTATHHWGTWSVASNVESAANTMDMMISVTNNGSVPVSSVELLPTGAIAACGWHFGDQCNASGCFGECGRRLTSVRCTHCSVCSHAWWCQQ
jgi:hypothetical protein